MLLPLHSAKRPSHHTSPPHNHTTATHAQQRLTFVSFRQHRGRRHGFSSSAQERRALHRSSRGRLSYHNRICRLLDQPGSRQDLGSRASSVGAMEQQGTRVGWVQLFRWVAPWSTRWAMHACATMNPPYVSLGVCFWMYRRQRRPICVCL